MIEVPVTQNTEEWHRQRAGIPTASAAKRLITPKTMKLSDQADAYMYELLAQRIVSTPYVPFQSFWMERGHQEEQNAVSLYEYSRDVETEPCGFLLNEQRTAGASPDRKVVGKKAGLEIKAPKDGLHLQYLCRDGEIWKDHKPQVQFQLWISGWDYMDMYSFHPEMPPALILTEPDLPYIRTLEQITLEFIDKLERKYVELVERGLTERQKRFSYTPKSETQKLTDAMRESLVAMHSEEGKAS